jgi:cobyrinic acid a,c-diamide synthase
MRQLPRIVVAGTRSGVGKTSIATGLMAALRRRGHIVANAKVGPDFIDPSYHALATGRPPRNLDAFLHGEARLVPLLLHGAAGAGVAVIEGVMGLFDGRAAGDEASTAHVARTLAAPVLLVVDASGSSRSVAAEVHGFATFAPSVRVAGVILNQVGSDGHEALLREALLPLGIPVVGVVRRQAELATPSRHLGLMPAAERTAEATRTVAALGEVVARSVDLDAVVRIARTAPPLAGEAWDPAAAVAGAVATDGPPPTIAVAGGAAFTFVYQEHRELLTAAGAEVVVLDPRADGALPPGTRGLYVGGGFPEAYVDELSANVPLRREVAAFDGPVVAECGGLVYLCRTLDGTELCGVLDADATFGDRLVLGYREATAAGDSVLARAGTTARGHEFHRTVVTPRAGDRPAWHLAGIGTEGITTDRVHASYLHASWVGAPSLAASFVRATARTAEVVA